MAQAVIANSDQGRGPRIAARAGVVVDAVKGGGVACEKEAGSIDADAGETALGESFVVFMLVS